MELIDDLPGALLETVFTHSSWAPDRASSYERLEFLGDSVLELAIARALYERYPDFSEGRMAKIRSHVVSRASCAVVSRELGLGRRLAERGEELAPADELERLSRNRNVLAALLEASLAALYLQHGFEPIRDAVVAAFDGRITYALTTPCRPQDRAPGGARPPGPAGRLQRARRPRGRRTTARSGARR